MAMCYSLSHLKIRNRSPGFGLSVISSAHLIFWQNLKLDTHSQNHIAVLTATQFQIAWTSPISYAFLFISIKYFDVNEMGNGLGRCNKMSKMPEMRRYWKAHRQQTNQLTTPSNISPKRPNQNPFRNHEINVTSSKKNYVFVLGFESWDCEKRLAKLTTTINAQEKAQSVRVFIVFAYKPKGDKIHEHDNQLTTQIFRT